ncbi:hypothetical protein [Asanoa iriomotensis]|uniref:Uncharacterized protein n=1 Tax=Asanoa iriomotensis TaxID=234613 RepID=A0ABQ4C3D2_9ACTN|nr:hypothetical protein [Asanoa iriomotensis]GIF56785.1 hypothetical protein Air01nite_28800 [Asanoa iriomotensis]
MIRLAFLVAGVGALGYGCWLLVPQLTTTVPWLIAGPIVHDLVVAPLLAGVGLILTRARVGAAVRTALMVTATLALIAVPLVWRPSAAPDNPGLQNRDYPRDLALWLTALWAALAVSWLLRRRRRVGPPTAGTRNE